MKLFNIWMYNMVLITYMGVGKWCQWRCRILLNESLPIIKYVETIQKSPYRTNITTHDTTWYVISSGQISYIENDIIERLQHFEKMSSTQHTAVIGSMVYSTDTAMIVIVFNAIFTKIWNHKFNNLDIHTGKRPWYPILLHTWFQLQMYSFAFSFIYKKKHTHVFAIN